MANEPKGGPEPGEPTPSPKCEACNGRGWVRDCVPYADRERCPECTGTGEVNDDSGGNIGVVKHCSWCGGTGIYQGKDTNDVGPCFGCDGTGRRLPENANPER